MARQIDEAKRLEIAMGALSVLRARGLHKTSMSEIARALEIKRPTLYWYFADIEAMFVWILDHTHERLAQHIATRLIGVDHPLDALRVLVEAELEFFAEEGMEDFMLFLAQFMAMGSADNRERFRSLVVRNVVGSRGLLVGMIQQGIDDGRVAPCDPGQLVDFLQTFLDGTLVHSALYGSGDTRAILDFAYEHVLEPLRR